MEIKDVLEFLDAKEVKDMDGFKKAFSEKFIPKSQASDDDEIKSKITGKFSGSLTTIAKREFDLTSDEVKDKKWEEILVLGASKIKSRIKELEDSASTGNDDKVKDLTAKFEKVQKEKNDLKGLLDNTTKTLTDKETEFNGKIKSFKSLSVLEKAKEKLSTKLKSDMSEAEKFYLDAKIKEKIVIDFNEQDEVLVLGADGKRLTSPTKAGAFMDLTEAIESEASALNLIKKNNGGGVDANKFFTQQQNITPAGNGQPVKTGRTVHPSALKNADTLKAQTA